MKISKIQYISTQYQNESFFDELQSVIDAGAEWIQIRVKQTRFNKWLEIAQKSVELCKAHNVICIINDNPVIAKKSGADGVHLGKNDMSPLDARKILVNHKIIGGTANTFYDIQRLANQGVDYIGLGPYRYTITKRNLSPFLGYSGYKSILLKCQSNAITTPIIAIGGITGDDVPSILQTGVYGFAFSGYIANAVDKKSIIDNLKKVLA